MKKSAALLIVLLALPLLGGCGEPEHVHTFSSDWSFSETEHWHAATCEHDVKDSLGNHVDTDANFICDVCGYELPVPPTPPAEWSEEQKQVFKDHLYGYELPCVDGLEVEWDADTSSVIVYGAAVDSESFNVYVNSIVAQGFSKVVGPYEDSYILLKDLEVEGKVRTIDIDIFINSGVLFAVCYDPYIYEWPADYIDILFDEYFYTKPSIEVPAVNADRFYVDTSYMESDAVLTIYGDSKTNLEDSYKNALIEKGFTISLEKDEDGFFVASESSEIVLVYFAYAEESQAFVVVIKETTGWPAQIVDYYTDQFTGGSGTRIPAVLGADKYEFIEASYDAYGYFFVLCETGNNLEEQYAKALDANYTVYNDAVNSAGNYFAISDNNDLLVQYKYIVVESIMGGDPYKHFDVLFEPYFPHNEEHINAGLQLINKGTETVIPEYPGYGEKITISDTDKYMFIEIQSAVYTSVAEYFDTLDKAGWAVKEESALMFNYEAISPNRDIKMVSSMQNGRVNLQLSAYEDEYKDWPEEGVQEILDTLGLKGEVPVFDGAFGYDYENTEYYHDIVCIVKPNKEEELVNAYTEKLIGLGWKHVIDGELDYYVKEGSDVGLVPYFESVGSGNVFIEIIHGDGTKYDIDARTVFVDWKIYFDIKSNLQIPGIILNDNVANIEFNYDAGVTYQDNYVFRLTVELTDGEVAAAISTINLTFENDGWVYSSDDTYYHKEDMWLNTHESEGKVVIDICSPIPINDLETLVKRFVFDEELTEWINIPENFNIVGEYELAISEYEVDYVNLVSTLTFEDHNAALAAKNAILTAFKGEGWVEVKSNPDQLQDDSWMPSLKVVVSLDDDSNVLIFSLVNPY